MTPHINAKENDFSDIVLMPGDPRRAEHIAKNFLTDYKLVTDVRGILGFTGLYKGRKISVMASGMGIPSIGIYAYELYNFYNVKTIIRIGTCGSNTSELNVFDLVLASKSITKSNFALEVSGIPTDHAYPDRNLNQLIKTTGESLSLNVKETEVLTSEAFYKIDYNDPNFKVVEMESFALFYLAEKLNKSAATLLTVSDSFVTKEETTALEREQKVDKMIYLALESALKIK